MHCHKNSHLSHLLRSTNLLIELVVLYLIRAFKWSLNCYESFTIIRRVITITNTQFHSFLHLFPKEKAIKLYCLSQLRYNIHLMTLSCKMKYMRALLFIFKIISRFPKLYLLQFTKLKICTNKE